MTALYSLSSPSIPVHPADVQSLMAQALDPLPLDGKRVLVIIPDGTRSAPIPLFFTLLNRLIGQRAGQLDYLIALGTHPPMADAAVDRLVGMPEHERAEKIPKVHIYNHRWDDPVWLSTLGTIPAAEMETLTNGLLPVDVPIRLNRLLLEYDQIILCGPVFPHEVVGFSGGAKYLFPGVAGPEVIHVTHWLGALITSMNTIGIKDTPVRRVIHRAAQFVDRSLLCMSMAVKGHDLHGLFIGTYQQAWEAAAYLSAQLNIIKVEKPFSQVLSMPAPLYDELWTAGKAMYKTEPVVADGGEVIIFAPHITEISRTHGALIRQVGYHVRDYFTKQWDHFRDIPWAVLAHSTHVRGIGTFEGGVEQARIRVTLATGIPQKECEQINLGYCDPASIDPAQWEHQEAQGQLLVRDAGEYLYRLTGGVY
jgi:nickel-dependent lactate racemase